MPFRSPQNFFAQINNFFFVVDPSSVSNHIFSTPLNDDNDDDNQCIKYINTTFGNKKPFVDLSRFYIRECCPNISRLIDPTIDVAQPQVTGTIKILKPSQNATVPLCYFSDIKLVGLVSYIFVNILLMVFCLNFFRFYRLSLWIGPLLIALNRTLLDCVKFIPIFLLIFLSYGVIQNNMIFPNQKGERELIGGWFLSNAFEMFLKPYFHIFGELFLVETSTYKYEPIEIECAHSLGDPDVLNRIRCPERNEFSTMLLAMYMMITNLVMLNMLIAMFNDTYRIVKNNARMIWATERYKFIIEGNHTIY